MFGIPALLAAIGRLTASVNGLADRFDLATDAIDAQFAPADRAPALPEPAPAADANGVTHARKAAKGRV